MDTDTASANVFSITWKFYWCRLTQTQMNRNLSAWNQASFQRVSFCANTWFSHNPFHYRKTIFHFAFIREKQHLFFTDLIHEISPDTRESLRVWIACKWLDSSTKMSSAYEDGLDPYLHDNNLHASFMSQKGTSDPSWALTEPSSWGTTGDWQWKERPRPSAGEAWWSSAFHPETRWTLWISLRRKILRRRPACTNNTQQNNSMP